MAAMCLFLVSKEVVPGKYVGIGAGLRTKVNASIGTSSDIVDLDAEVRKAHIAEEAGADTLMEQLSVGGDLDQIRREVIAATSLNFGDTILNFERII